LPEIKGKWHDIEKKGNIFIRTKCLWKNSETFCLSPFSRVCLIKVRRRWVDNIRMDLQEVGCGYMDWIGLTQDTDRWYMLEIAVMNLRVP